MKYFIFLLSLVSLSQALFINRVIKTFTTPIVQPPIELKPDEVTSYNKLYEANQLAYSQPLVLRPITTRDIIRHPVFQNVVRQSIEQGTHLDLTKLLPPSDHSELIHIMEKLPTQGRIVDPVYIPHTNQLPVEQLSTHYRIESPIYIPPANQLPLEPIIESSRFTRPISVIYENSPQLSISNSVSHELPVQTNESIIQVSSGSSRTQVSSDSSSTQVSSDSSNIVKQLSKEEKQSTDVDQLPFESRPVDFNNDGKLISEEVRTDDDENDFSHSYVLKDGTKVSEKGRVIKDKDGSTTVAKEGSYQWVDANGKIVKVNWVADDEGFRVLE